MSTFSSAQPLLTITEAAQLFKVKRPTVAGWIRNGGLKAFKIGGMVRIRVEDVEVFIAENERQRQLATVTS